jgi:hypothetical protein
MPSLPNEIWFEILSALDIWDLWVLRRVSKMWCQHILAMASELATQSSVDLFVAGAHEIDEYHWEGHNMSRRTTYNTSTQMIHFWFNANHWSPEYYLEEPISEDSKPWFLPKYTQSIRRNVFHPNRVIAI